MKSVMKIFLLLAIVVAMEAGELAIFIVFLAYFQILKKYATVRTLSVCLSVCL
jgi:hypothetical protein